MAVTNKFALLVGCNYPNLPEKNQLHGCINDVNFMHDLIRRPCFGFQDRNITILTDETGKKPTFSNILEALTGTINAAKPGDTLLFYFSGGGALKPDTNDTKIKKGIPAIIPCDLYPITAKDILPKISQLRDGVFFTFICDSSYSGGLFDGKDQTESKVSDLGPNFHRKTIPSKILQLSDTGGTLPATISLPNKILFSSSRANEESVEVYPNLVKSNNDKSKAFSAFSNAIQTFSISPEALNPSVRGNDLNALYSILEVVAFTRVLLGVLGFYQHPYLNYSDAAAPFLGNVT